MEVRKATRPLAMSGYRKGKSRGLSNASRGDVVKRPERLPIDIVRIGFAASFQCDHSALKEFQACEYIFYDLESVRGVGNGFQTDVHPPVLHLPATAFTGLRQSQRRLQFAFQQGAQVEVFVRSKRTCYR
jgi:hypothetical protein